MNPTDRLNLTRVELERRRVAAATYVSRHAHRDVMDDVIYDRLMYRVESHVMANQLDAQTATAGARVPATWWQHFKLDAIKWGNPFFRKDRIKYAEVSMSAHFKAWATFPESTIDFPPTLGRPRIVMENTVSDVKGWPR